MKFTEEQYQKIVDVVEEYSATSGWGIVGDLDSTSIGRKLWKSGMGGDFTFYEQAEKILAIANPLTREWAHDKFVEKEKEFYWTSKKQDKKGFSTRIMIDRDGLVRTYPIKDITKHEEDEQLTESEIRAWGCNPEMFDREEVQ